MAVEFPWWLAACPSRPMARSGLSRLAATLHALSAAPEHWNLPSLEFEAMQPEPLHGWVFLEDPKVILPAQAIRFVSGMTQHQVLVGADGLARTPTVLAESWPPGMPYDERHEELLAACTILPTDYVSYGGDAVRWERDDDEDADCSSGCRWFNPLYDRTCGPDSDWGVCANPRSPRRGLLTFEHQAGRGCFEQAPRD